MSVCKFDRTMVTFVQFHDFVELTAKYVLIMQNKHLQALIVKLIYIKFNYTVLCPYKLF